MKSGWSLTGLVEKWQAISKWGINLRNTNGRANGRHSRDDRQLANISTLEDRQLANILMISQL